MSNVSLINGHIDGAETCVICGRDIPEGSQVCVICGKVGKGKMTNYDRIRNMSVEELASFINERSPCSCCKKHNEQTCHNIFCKQGIKQWLESEVTE